MANWEKLNAEFDALIDKLTIEDWHKWNENRSKKRLIRKAAILLKAKMRSEKLLMAKFDGTVIVDEKFNSTELVCINIASINGGSYTGNDSTFAMAA